MYAFFFLQILYLTPRRNYYSFFSFFFLFMASYALFFMASYALFFMAFSLSSCFNLLFVCLVQVFLLFSFV